MTDRFDRLWPGVGRDDPAFRPGLVGTTWMFVEVDGRPLAGRSRTRPPSIELTADGQRVTGFTGCNRLLASYELAGDTLRFGHLTTTRRACPRGAELERDLLAALEATRSHRIVGRALELRAEASVRARLLTP